MVARRRWEGESRERKRRKSTADNGAAKQGQTAEEDKKQKRGDLVATTGVVPCPGPKKYRPVSPGHHVGFCSIVRPHSQRQTSVCYLILNALATPLKWSLFLISSRVLDSCEQTDPRINPRQKIPFTSSVII